LTSSNFESRTGRDAAEGHHSQVDLDAIAARAIGFSGAMLQNLMNEAAIFAARRGAWTASARAEEAPPYQRASTTARSGTS